MPAFIILSGCSGGGKSTLLAALRRRGEVVIEEPGRRIVAEQRASGGTALPWVDGVAFARRAIDVSRSDLRSASGNPGRVFCDRGLIDAAVALEHLTGEAAADTVGQTHRFHHTVFLAPPWPEIYEVDAERRHGLDQAIEEYRRLHHAYRALGFDISLLPKTDVSRRADFVLSALA